MYQGYGKHLYAAFILSIYSSGIIFENYHFKYCYLFHVITNLYRNKNNQKSYMINENQECKMTFFIKIIEKIFIANTWNSHLQNPYSRVINTFVKLDTEI